MTLTQRFVLPFARSEDETDITVFSPSLRFTSESEPRGSFDISTRAWEKLGKPRAVVVTVEAAA